MDKISSSMQKHIFTMKSDLDKIVEEKKSQRKTSHHNTDKTIHSR